MATPLPSKRLTDEELAATQRKPDGTLDPVRPSTPIREWFQAYLEREVEALNKSVVFWFKVQWRATNPRNLAMDASPARELNRVLRQRGRLWRIKFRAMADQLAREFAGKNGRHVDRALQAMLKDNGLTIRFRMTPEMNDIVQASVAENVKLITSLADQQLLRVEGAVMRAVQTGTNLQQLNQELVEGLGIAKRRAAFIARQQTSMATATMARARHMELGCEEGIWLHSAGGRKPRPEHVAFSRKRYSLSKGAFLEGKWTHPGVEPNCRCVGRPVLPSLAERSA